MNNNTLLSCPLCTSVNGKHPVLGKILNDGAIVIMRYHTGTTVLRGPHLSVSCGCGYSLFYSGTALEGTALVQL